MSQNLRQILPFAQARDLLGFSEKKLSCSSDSTPRAIIESIQPGFLTIHTTFRVALDEEYASWDQPILDAQVLAILPPVSGG